MREESQDLTHLYLTAFLHEKSLFGEDKWLLNSSSRPVLLSHIDLCMHSWTRLLFDSVAALQMRCCASARGLHTSEAQIFYLDLLIYSWKISLIRQQSVQTSAGGKNPSESCRMTAKDASSNRVSTLLRARLGRAASQRRHDASVT